MASAQLYRYFNAAGDLLYIGITSGFDQRDATHRSASDWRKDAVRSEVQACRSREHALALERVAIQFEQPLHNVVHKAAKPKPEIVEVAGDHTDTALREEIEEFLARTSLGEHRAGILLARNGKLFDRLRNGTRIWPDTAAEIRANIALQYAKRGIHPGQHQSQEAS